MLRIEGRTAEHSVVAPGERLGPLDGKFLILSRYPSPNGSHEVLGEFTPGKFCARFGVALPADGVSAAQVSDLCVAAFDVNCRVGGWPATFAYQTADGRVVHQHST